MQPPWTEVLGHVNVSTYKSWDDLGRWYWGPVKDQLVADDEVRRRAEALTQGLKDDRAKARAIYDYVVQKTRYVALEFGIHGFKPYRALRFSPAASAIAKTRRPSSSRCSVRSASRRRRSSSAPRTRETSRRRQQAWLHSIT